MTRGTDAFDGLDDEFGGKGRTYRERDVPPNQVFQNLETRCAERLKGWDRKSFAEKIQIEMETAGYLRQMRDLLVQHGIKLPGVGRFSTTRLEELEGLHNREDLASLIEGTRDFVERLRLGMDFAKDLYQAYEDLIDHDQRVNPVIREQLKTTLKPIAREEAMRQIQKAGGPDSQNGAAYMLDESHKLGDPIVQLVAQRQQGHTSTALVPVDRTLIEIYVKNYYKLEAIFKVIYWRVRQESRELARLEQSLQARGGLLTPTEQQRLAQFEGGRDPDRNIGVYTAYLDYLRFVGETTFRHGWPGQGRGK